MENKSHALAAGSFVLAVFALLVGLAMWLLRDVANTDTYEMVTSEAVTGLQPQAPVRYKGVSVGKVTSVSFDSDTGSDVRVRIAVNPDTPITQSTFAQLTFQGVTGLAYVQLDDTGGSNEPLTRGPNGPPRIPLKPNTLGLLTENITNLMKKAESIADNLNAVLDDGNKESFKVALKEMGTTVRETGEAAAAIKQLALNTDKTIQAQFGAGKLSIPELVQQAGKTLKTIETASASASVAMDSLTRTSDEARQGLAAITGQNGALQQFGDSAATFNTTTLPSIQGLTDNADHAVRRFDRAIGGLRDNPQALIYGEGFVQPGPGEPGFTAPAPAR
ncbi:MlaD family protein [Ottowia sp.]|uniref:MlaD family protein n=1 Tax=Ottowia sp. TaxID=1898956 RepID=UPI003A89A1F7